MRHGKLQFYWIFCVYFPLSLILFIKMMNIFQILLRFPHTYSWAARQAGGKILVCPHCAEVGGVTQLRDGAQLATAETLAQVFLQADKVIDY